MKINGTIEISGCDTVVIDRDVCFKRELDEWYNVKNANRINCDRMSNLVKHFVSNKTYKVWASGNTINIVRRE